MLSCEYAERDNLNSSTARLRSKYVNGQRVGYDYLEIVDSGVCSTQKVTTTSKKEDYGTVFSKSLEYDSLMYGIMNMSDHVSYDDFGRFNGQTVNMNNYQYYKTVDYLVDTSSSTLGNVTKVLFKIENGTV